jgi:hypothetical protein
MNYVCGLAWLIRVTRLIRCTGIPRINHEAPIRHDRRRSPPRRWYGWDGRDVVRPERLLFTWPELESFTGALDVPLAQPCVNGHSRSVLRRPCAGVHHSTTSIVASALRWVCTTSAMSAWKRSPSGPSVIGPAASARPEIFASRPWRCAGRTGDPGGDPRPCARPPSSRTPARHPRRPPRSRRSAATRRLAGWRSSCAGERRTAPAPAARTPAPPARRPAMPSSAHDRIRRPAATDAFVNLEASGSGRCAVGPVLEPVTRLPGAWCQYLRASACRAGCRAAAWNNTVCV